MAFMFLIVTWHSIMVQEPEKRSFATVKGSLQEELGRELSQREAVEIMAELTSEHLRSCESQIPREYRNE